MAFVSTSAPPVFTEYTSGPAMSQAALPPVYIGKPQAPVILQAAPVVVPAQPAVTVVQDPGAVVMQPSMSSIPVQTTCGFCQKQIVTMTRPINGLLNWMIFGVLFLLCLWPCCLIPLFVKACKDVEHSCPNCKNVIYIYQIM